MANANVNAKKPVALSDGCEKAPSAPTLKACVPVTSTKDADGNIVYDGVPEIKHPGQRLQRLNFKAGFAGDLVFIDYMIQYWTTRKDYVIGLGDDSVKLDTKIKEMEAKLAALKAKKAPAPAAK